MKSEEFSFFNQQLAGMLQAGIPLEGSLRKLSAEFKRKKYRKEFEELERQLAEGVPVQEAIQNRKFPKLYRDMVVIGMRGNDLPGVLRLLADYYAKVHALAARLKGLLVYPALVLAASIALSVFLALLMGRLSADLPGLASDEPALYYPTPPIWWVTLLMPPMVLSLLGVLFVLIIAIRPLRRELRWRVPAFREAALAQLAFALELLTRKGVPLPEALQLMREIEGSTQAGQDLERWGNSLASGRNDMALTADQSKRLPPLFFWLVSQCGDEIADGFARAAEVYYTRAQRQIEIALYALMPVLIVLVGLLILSELYPLVRGIADSIGLLNNLGAAIPPPPPPPPGVGI